MKLYLLITIFCFTVLVSVGQNHFPKFDVQGHRGARGLMPENTVPAFLLALDSGVTTLEMDLAVTKDRQLVVSHEPWMNAAICQNPNGQNIKEKDEKKFNLFQMTYEQVKAWDCGSKPNEKFPQQSKLKTAKPLLREVIVAVEDHIKSFTQYEVDYNIEIKSSPAGDNKFHPKPAEFADLVYEFLDQYLPMERVVIQSFDFRVLQYLHKKHPKLRLALLIENLHSIEDNIKKLGFTPSIYSPDFTLLSKDEIKTCHRLKMRVVPWTVNEEKDMTELKQWGVDGIITDYPDCARKLKLTLPMKSFSGGKK